MSKEILMVAQAVSNEKSVDREIIFDAIEIALATSGKKRFGHDVDIRVEIDHVTGEYVSFRRWLVVPDDILMEAPETIEESEKITVYNEHIHILHREALAINPGFEVGQYREESIENVAFSRIAAQMSKQIIIQKIREAERNQIVAQYLGRENSLVLGVVKRVTKDFIIVDLGNNAEGLLPRDQLVCREIYRVNDRLKAVITEVRAEGRGPQVVLSRTVPEMIMRLFEVEVPEIAEQVITIERAARDPGIRSKIAVHTNDTRIDPVGACVGIRGSRVQAITNELDGERVDIITWNDEPAQLIINVLAPAEIESIVIDEEGQSMDVAVKEENLAMAIGRNGQNVRLASQLTGWTINILSVEEALAKQSASSENWLSTLTETLDIDNDIAELLIAEGYTGVGIIAQSSVATLADINGFDEEIAEELISRANDALLAMALTGDIKQPAEDLLTMEGMDEGIANKLAQMDIVTMEDLAELSIDELMMINDESMTTERASKLIMTAREPWFE